MSLSGLRSFASGWSTGSNIDRQNQARSIARRQDARLEEEAQRVRNFDIVSEMTGLATDLGVTKRGGEEIDPLLMAELVNKQSESGKFDPKLERLVTLVANQDMSVKRNAGFQFTNLQRGPDGTFTLQGAYEGDDTPKFFTSNRGKNTDSPVGFGDADEVAGLVANGYNSIWNLPGNAPLKREIQLKNNISQSERDTLQGQIQTAVGQLTNELEQTILDIGGPNAPEIATKLKRALAGKPYTEQLEILQQYGAELQVPTDQIITPEVQEAVKKEASFGVLRSDGNKDNSAAIADLERRIANQPQTRGGAKRRGELQKELDALKAQGAPTKPTLEEITDTSPFITSVAEKAVEATDEDIVEGRVQVTQEEIDALQERLKGKGIRQLEDLINATPTEVQAMRAVLSTVARDKEQRLTYLERLNNVMATGSPDYNAQELDAAVLAERTEDRQQQAENRMGLTFKLNLDKHLLAAQKFSQEVGEKLGSRIRDNFKQAGDAIYGVDGDGQRNTSIPRDFDKKRFFSEFGGPTGAFTKMYRDYQNARGDEAKAQTRLALNSMISMGIQALAESEEYGSFLENFLPDGSIDYINGSDIFLERLEIKPDGSFAVINPATGQQVEETIPASVIKELFGPAYAYVVREIKGGAGSARGKNKTSQAD